MRMLAENLIQALQVAIAAQTPRDKAQLAGGVSTVVRGWEQVLAALQRDERVELVQELVVPPAAKPAGAYMAGVSVSKFSVRGTAPHLSAEASTLQLRGTPESIVVMGFPRPGMETLLTLRQTERAQGEVVGWTYRSQNERYEALVIND